MRFARLVTLIVGISFILGLMLWLIDSLYRLYIQVSFTTPFLANILLLLLIVLLGLLIAAFIYYFNLFSLRKSPRNARKQRRITTRLPEQKAEAAQVNLQAVRQQVTQIQDRVSQEALLARSRIIESTLNRGELRVVIFGTGSAGKTSVVNSILGEMVGEVNPSMGTTQVGETYSLQLPGLNRQILITDTPGILEAGVAGTQREEMARELATSADLLLFVVDNDLRQSEYEPLLRLAEMGKRSLLVLNKCDLYTERDREIILARLREVVRNFIATADIIAISANPQPATLNTGELVYVASGVLLWIRRLAAVLRGGGAALCADKTLLQSQRFGEEARLLI
ncbi:MAG: Era-like GTP-binding protein, partial [Jaaginema sp. PMC 1079.18]|nr:Era-like GTP-binding protein [Jaaginema sp. PMC 1079.18]